MKTAVTLSALCFTAILLISFFLGIGGGLSKNESAQNAVYIFLALCFIPGGLFMIGILFGGNVRFNNENIAFILPAVSALSGAAFTLQHLLLSDEWLMIAMATQCFNAGVFIFRKLDDVIPLSFFLLITVSQTAIIYGLMMW